MNIEQYVEIKNRAWNWYKNGMRSWSLATIKDFANAPQWAKDAVCYYQGNAKLDFAFIVDCDDVNLLKKYDAQIDAMLRASQRLNFEVNYVKELLEFYEAHRDKDEYEMIDALCDMIIISLNAGGYLGNDFNCTTNENLVCSLTDRNMQISGLLAELVVRGYDAYKCLCETVKELESRSGSWNEELGKWCKDLGAYTEEEAIKKVSDKVWSEHHSLDSVEKQKEDDDYWYFNCEIDDGYYTEEKARKWYKADYSECKLPEHDPF